ncbi:MAG: FAD:protein FMN transferase [Dehalococcoidia bacterium]|nr:FAD:protein FMN transferase [Dehalococcoidia bacterium]
MGTQWQLETWGSPPAALRAAEDLVRDIEQRCSRFLPDSALSRLNRDRRIQDPLLADITSLALEFREATAGAFDPAVGDAVVAAGYDRSMELVRSSSAGPARDAVGHPAIPVHGDVIELRGPGQLDLGGIAKGWAVDRVGRLLQDAGAHRYFVDGGGDVLLGGERDEEELVELCTGGYRVGVRAGGLASSSTLHRRWATAGGDAHHIIDPRSDRPSAGEWVQSSVLAPDATTADVLATALLANAEAALPALARRGAEALLVAADGHCMMTPGLARYLR